MSRFLTTASTLALLAMPAASPVRAAFVTGHSLTSPDGKLTFTLERDDTNNRFHGSVKCEATTIVTRGVLGIIIQPGPVEADDVPAVEVSIPQDQPSPRFFRVRARKS